MRPPFVTYLLWHSGTPLKGLRETTALWMLCLKLYEADQMSMKLLVFYSSGTFYTVYNLFAVSDPVLLGDYGKTRPKLQ